MEKTVDTRTRKTLNRKRKRAVQKERKEEDADCTWINRLRGAHTKPIRFRSADCSVLKLCFASLVRGNSLSITFVGCSFGKGLLAPCTSVAKSFYYLGFFECDSPHRFLESLYLCEENGSVENASLINKIKKMSRKDTSHSLKSCARFLL